MRPRFFGTGSAATVAAVARAVLSRLVGAGGVGSAAAAWGVGPRLCGTGTAGVAVVVCGVCPRFLEAGAAGRGLAHSGAMYSDDVLTDGLAMVLGLTDWATAWRFLDTGWSGRASRTLSLGSRARFVGALSFRICCFFDGACSATGALVSTVGMAAAVGVVEATRVGRFFFAGWSATSSASLLSSGCWSRLRLLTAAGFFSSK